MIYGRDEGLHAVMFRVQTVGVFAETEPGRLDPIPGKRAVVNTDSRRVLSVVSDQYRLLPNDTALELAYRCCITAFPNTAQTDWDVFSVEASSTGGHCRIDLQHSGDVLTYDWAFSEKVQDRWQPFVRVTNSYNRTRVFSLHFGFIRWACKNGMIDWHSSIRVSFAHNTKDIVTAIKRGIDEAKFAKVKEEFRAFLQPLVDVSILPDRFRPIIQSVLEIRRPTDLPKDRQVAWQALEQQIDRTITKYIREFGSTAYALMNAISDLATRPPTQVCGYCFEWREEHRPEHEQQEDKDRRRPYSFIRRDRHSLQRLAGAWVAEFSRSVRRGHFDLEAYLRNPSHNLLRRAADRTGRNVPGRRRIRGR